MVGRTAVPDHGHLMRSARGVALAVLAALILSACGERINVTGTAGAARPGTGTSGGSIDPRLVGQWSRTLVFQDNTGAIQASRTTWRFASDASATRAVVASNLTFGFVDSVVTHARWRIRGGRLAVTFLPPSSAEVLFEYRLEGTRLLLGGLPFDRQ